MEPFKNKFNKKSASEIALALMRVYPSFDKKSFLKNIDQEISTLELKERVSFLAKRIKKFLPEDLKKSLEIIRDAIKKDADKEKSFLAGFTAWPLMEFVSLFGLDEFDLSMNVLKEGTVIFTGEFAVRNFFIFDQEKTMSFFYHWAEDKNEHVRRLASEGSRPLLPWGKKLTNVVLDPNTTWGLLEKLKKDESLYVRKSIANHINDHSKNHPDFVIKKLLKWKKAKDYNQNLEWIVKHGTRTLIKAGHPQAFFLHGVAGKKIQVCLQKIINKKIRLGEVLKTKIILKNNSAKKIKVIADQELHLLRANKKYKIKCFKGKNLMLEPFEKKEFFLNLPLKFVTTRSYYGGVHFWNIKVNGASEKALKFNLEIPDPGSREKNKKKLFP